MARPDRTEAVTASRRTFDLAIVGLGAVGATAAWLAATQGASVIAFERFELAHARGSTHGGSRLVRTLFDESPDLLPLARRGRHLFHQLEREAGVPLVTVTGGIIAGPTGGTMIAETGRRVREGGVDAYPLSPRAAAARFPVFRFDAEDEVWFEPDAAVVSPEQTVRSAVALARARGAVVETGARVESVREDDRGVELVVDGRTHRVRAAIVAVGAWAATQDVAGSAGVLPLRAVRSTTTWFASEARITATMPVFVWHVDGRRAWGARPVDRRGVKVSVSVADVDAADADPDSNADKPVTPSEQTAVEQFVSRRLRGVSPIVSASAPCMKSVPDDGLPVIGPLHPGSTVIYCAGLDGFGFKHAPALAADAVSLALGEPASPTAALLTPTRFARRQEHSA